MIYSKYTYHYLHNSIIPNQNGRLAPNTTVTQLQENPPVKRMCLSLPCPRENWDCYSTCRCEIMSFLLNPRELSNGAVQFLCRTTGLGRDKRHSDSAKMALDSTAFITKTTVGFWPGSYQKQLWDFGLDRTKTTANVTCLQKVIYFKKKEVSPPPTALLLLQKFLHTAEARMSICNSWNNVEVRMYPS